MTNVIEKIEQADTMNEVGEILSEFYDHVFLMGSLSTLNVDSGRLGLRLASDIDSDTIDVEVEEAKDIVLGSGSHKTGFKSPKAVRWSPELDKLIVGAATRGLDLEKLSGASKNGVTTQAIRSRLYKLNYKYDKESCKWYKDIAEKEMV